MELTEAILRSQLNGILEKDFKINEIEILQNRKNRHGEVYLERDRLTFVIERRLLSVKKKSVSPETLQRHQSALKTLRYVKDDEAIYFWSVADDESSWSGFSTANALIIFYDH